MNKSNLFSFTFPINFIPSNEKDFTIHVGPIEYKCHSCYIAAFSPFINRLFICDHSMNEIQYPYNDPNNLFKNIIRLIYGEKIALNEKNIIFFEQAAFFFENEHLLRSVSEYFIKKSREDVINRLQKNHPIKFIEKEIEYVAEHFEDFMNEVSMFQLPLLYYDTIFSCLKFSISDEYIMFHWITKLIQIRGPAFICLYSHAFLECLDETEVNEFLRLVPFENIDGALWKSVLSRLSMRLNSKESNEDQNQLENPESSIDSNNSNNDSSQKSLVPYTDKVVDVPPELQIISRYFPYREGGHFKGIFNFISQNGNPQHRGYVTMDCGGTKRRFLHILVGNYTDTTFKWDNFGGKKCLEKDQWFIIQFLIYKVKLEKYTLSCPEDKPDRSQPKSWRLFGSNNGEDWKLIHEIKNCDRTNTHKPIIVFNCQSQEFFSYFKFVQLENHSKRPEAKYEFTLNHVEFFGEVQKL
ncbi:hypothetical protein M9Y10_044392 [Tritrichomonas musculus]|uniref:BTB domain-containing protein n=1 Tax=Tritrichomonas musculus TaxID=1915356 RepID=A0ABR2JS95_9EUKA